MDKPCIAVDVDEVLGAFVEALCLYHNRNHGTDLDPSHFDSYHFSNVPGFGSESVTHQKILAFFESVEFEQIAPLAEARSVLQKHSATFNFIVVTSRSDTYEDKTMSWLQQHYKDVFAGVHFANHYGGSAPPRTKGTICREIGALSLIDDAVPYAVDAASCLPFGSFLHGEYAWNKALGQDLPSKVIRTLSWRHLDALLSIVARAVAGTDGSPAMLRTASERYFSPDVHLGHDTVDDDAVAAVHSKLDMWPTVHVYGALDMLKAVAGALRGSSASVQIDQDHERQMIVTRGEFYLARKYGFVDEQVMLMSAGLATTPLSTELDEAREQAAREFVSTSSR